MVHLPLPLLADEARLAILGPDRVVTQSYQRDGERKMVASKTCLRKPPSIRLSSKRLVGAWPVYRPPRMTSGRRAAHSRRRTAVRGLGSVADGFGSEFTHADVTVARIFASPPRPGGIRQLYHEVQEADRQKNEFLAMLAHELRNPLAPIRNANEVLRQKADDLTRVHWVQGVIDRQLTHLVRLVDDLLDVSRLTQGKIRLEFEEVELGEVIAQAVEAARPLIDRHDHVLDVQVPPHSIRLRADKARLTQVVTNLLNNAAKYTDPGGSISLVVAQAGEQAVVRVRDNGIGIAPDLLTRVFELFTQANRSLDRSQGGLGIGLTLVRRLIELHEGAVEAHSAGLGKGSEFVVRLPTISAEANLCAFSSMPMGNGQSVNSSLRLRTIVVDDNVDAAESLADLLRMLGHEVQVAHDGPGGLAVARAAKADVVLLDIGLPGMSGYEVARRLRADPDFTALLVAVSGYGREEDRHQSKEAGIEHHFVKPLDFRQLQQLLDHVCTSRTQLQ